MRKFITHLFVLSSILTLIPSAVFAEQRELTEAERNYILAETLNRIQGDLASKPDLKRAVYETLPKLRGTETFVRIVKKFGLKDQDAELVTIALANADKDLGVEAAQLVLDHGNLALLGGGLARTNNDAINTARVLGNVKEKRVVPALVPIMMDDSRDLVLRKAVVHALSQTQEGALQVIELARSGKLADSLKLSAASELSSVRWSNVKAEAEKVFPPVQGKGTQVFPPVAALAKMKGDRANGEKVFFLETSMCSRCHEVRGRGGQIGPALSEIGNKLGRDALIEAILDPSAGISFGFEAFNVTLKNGDEAYGLVASETADELAIKDLNGIVSRYKKSNIAKRDQLKTSIMPTGLQQTMTVQEFVDVIEYLSSLKKIEEVRK